MEVLTITESAREHLVKICQSEVAVAVSFGVTGGGCSGFSYKWDTMATLDDIGPSDEVIALNDEFKLVLDELSIMYIIGVEIDYVREVWGSAIKVNNPNTASQCGCGESFSVK